MLSNINSTTKCRYRLTHPISSNKIYESASFEVAVKQCYNDFKELTDIPEGIFIITDLTNKKKFTFEVNKRKSKQKGGFSKDVQINQIDNQVNIEKQSVSDNEIVQLKDTISNINTKIKSLENKLNTINDIDSDSDNIYNVMLSESYSDIKEKKETIEDNNYCTIQ